MTVLGSDRDIRTRPEHEQLLDRLEFRLRPVEDERVHGVVAELDAVADDGAALVRTVELRDPDGVFEYVRETPNSSVEGMLRYSTFLRRLLTSEPLNDSIDGLDTTDGFLGDDRPDDTGGTGACDPTEAFERYDPLFVDGYVAHRLAVGGVYSSFDSSHAAAKDLGRQFERAVVGSRYESVVAWRLTGTRWSRWFSGIPHHDETLVCVDSDRSLA